MKTASLLLLLSVSAFSAAPAQPQLTHRLPKLTSVFPQGARPGENVRVEILGEFLDRTSTVLFLDGSISGQVADAQPSRLRLHFQVGKEASFGPHYFRILSPRGPSNLLLFRVGDLPHITEHEPNSTFSEANPVEPPVTINGRLNVDDDFDFYRFHAEAGQTWIFDLRAARNGNGLDAALILLDEQAHEIVRNEDYFIWDPFLEHKFDRSGTYTVVVQPTHTQLDPNFAYQLDIRTAPHIETVAPISLAPGARVDATLYGAGLLDKSAKLIFAHGGGVALGFSGRVLDMRDSSALVRIEVPQDAHAGAYELMLATPTGNSDSAMFLVDATPAYPGTGPIRPPISITGTIRYRDPERFWFEAKKGQALVFEVRARRYGSPVDSVLRILDEKGKELARNDDANFPGVADNKDSQIVHTFSEDGRYQVEIRNLVRVAGEDYPYQLLVYPAMPHANLMLSSDQLYVDAEGEGEIDVHVERLFGFDGAVELSVAGLPEGVTAAQTVVPPGESKAKIQLHALNVKPGVFSTVHVLGKEVELPAWRSVKISGGDGEGQTFCRVDGPTLAVTERPLFVLEAEVTRANVVRGGAVDIPVLIERASGFSDDIEFQVDGLPQGVSAEPLVAHDGQSNVRIRLKASSSAASGRTKEIQLIGVAQGHVEEAPAISVQVD